jgi:hypothetical protein
LKTLLQLRTLKVDSSKVLYKKGDIEITSADDAEAASEAGDRVPGLADLLNATVMIADEEKTLEGIE